MQYIHNTQPSKRRGMLSSFLMCKKSFSDINGEYRCKHTRVTCRSLFAKDVLYKVQLYYIKEIEKYTKS